MKNLKWWQTAVFYQIYPRSFADGNGDGVGDLQGIIDKLDYLVDLGIDALWLSPHFPSPQFDCGYDIADYTNVNPEYGTLEDFQNFLDEAHGRGLRVILDLVLNHTSDQHPWFLESRSSRDNPKRDWYIWRDSAPPSLTPTLSRGEREFCPPLPSEEGLGVRERDRHPPNNWSAAFDDCAWTYDEATDQWYYHFFFAQQPDLNWRNPEVKAAMWEAARFWLDLGVDGFRLDAIGTIFEDPDLPDHEAEISMTEMFQEYMASYPQQPTPEQNAYLAEQRELMNAYQVSQPGIHELLQEFRALVDEYDDRVLVGEIDEIEFYGDGTNELHMIFNFPLMRTDKLTPAWIRKNQAERLGALPPAAWPCNTLGNHDCDRLASTFGTTDELARLSLALMLTLKGTPFLYNGEEIGMTNLTLENIHQFRDNLGVWVYQEALKMGTPRDKAFTMAHTITRDKCRSPMQWLNAPNGGFSPESVETWLPVNPDYAEGVNVAEQSEDPESLLNFYKRLLAVRKKTTALIAGEYQVQHKDAEDYLAFTRFTKDQNCLVVLNYTDQEHELTFGPDTQPGKVLFSNLKRAKSVGLHNLKVYSFEILIIEY